MPLLLPYCFDVAIHFLLHAANDGEAQTDSITFIANLCCLYTVRTVNADKVVQGDTSGGKRLVEIMLSQNLHFELSVAAKLLVMCTCCSLKVISTGCSACPSAHLHMVCFPKCFFHAATYGQYRRMEHMLPGRRWWP